jgi:HPt (histidine-containing phosphotransfer) domain-containing protein
MTIQECYQAMGADYEDVINRLRSTERVERFARKVLTDPSYGQLCAALEQGNAAEAFRAAHTMKGISQNLSLTKLAISAEALTEALRDQPSLPEGLAPLVDAVKADYEMTTQTLRGLDE